MNEQRHQPNLLHDYSTALKNRDVENEWRERRFTEKLTAFSNEMKQLEIAEKEVLGIIIAIINLLSLEHTNNWHVVIVNRNRENPNENINLAHYRSSARIYEQTIAQQEVEFSKILIQYPMAANTIRKLREELTLYSLPAREPLEDPVGNRPILHEPHETAGLRSGESMWEFFQKFISARAKDELSTHEQSHPSHDEIESVMNTIIEKHARPWYSNPFDILLNKYGQVTIREAAFQFLNDSDHERLHLQPIRDHITQLLNEWLPES